MRSMKGPSMHSRSIVAATIIFAALLSLKAQAAEHGAAPKTLDEQINYLEGALAESFRTRDLTMLEMAVKGFKAAGLNGKELELSVLRAERDAAWTNAAPGYLQ